MALESVDYSEDKACKILEIVMQDDKNTKVESKQEIVEGACVDNETAAATDASPPLPLSKSDARYLAIKFHFKLGYFDMLRKCEGGHIAFSHLFSHLMLSFVPLENHQRSRLD